MRFEADIYEVIRAGCQKSAATVVPMLDELFDPTTVIDVGCGEGWWLEAFAERGCEVTGVDGHDGTSLAIAPERYQRVDLAAGKLELGHHDLALCLEVAEHLPADRADVLVDALTDAADTVVFSAAIPGQGGTGHINEQWPAYWAHRFTERGFAVSGALRWRLWPLAPEHVENWYAQNLLLCAADPGPNAAELFGDHAEPISVVHPVLWDARRPR